MAAVNDSVVVPETSVWVDYFKEAQIPYVDTLKQYLWEGRLATPDVIRVVRKLQFPNNIR